MIEGEVGDVGFFSGFVWGFFHYFFIVIVTEHWHRLPRGAMESLPLGDIQRPPGHSAGQLALGIPA